MITIKHIKSFDLGNADFLPIYENFSYGHLTFNSILSYGPRSKHSRKILNEKFFLNHSECLSEDKEYCFDIKEFKLYYEWKKFP